MTDIVERMGEQGAESEAAEVKQALGIGSSLEDRISKLKNAQFQYCSAGTARAMVNEIERLRAERDAGWSIGNRAKKKIGYRFNGEVRSVFTTRTGETRLVVELIGDNGGGLLHIFNPNQMEKSHD